jgi:hypothetical protein
MVAQLGGQAGSLLGYGGDDDRTYVQGWVCGHDRTEARIRQRERRGPAAKLARRTAKY